MTFIKNNLIKSSFLIIVLFVFLAIFPNYSNAFFSVNDLYMATYQGRINIQTALNQILVPSPNLKVDGNIGSASRQAIMRFQSQNGLVADGKVGIVTRTALSNSSSKTTIIESSSSRGGGSSGGGGGGGSSDKTKPVVTSFLVPSTTDSLTVPVTSFVATDNVGVTGYMLTTNYSAPRYSSSSWSSTPPTSYAFSTTGSKKLYAWAKDAAKNVSKGVETTFTINTSIITLPDSTAPIVTAFVIPATATSLTVPITTFTATDNTAVTGYLLTESSSTPSASSGSWTSSVPTSYSFGTSGSKTLYAWAKDAAGNVSTSLNDSVTITLPDSTAPTVTAFVIPSTSTSLTVPITTFTATDNTAVTGYLLTESSSTPSASSGSWTSSVPTSYTFGSILGAYKHNFTLTLRRGITGEEVRQLQIFLNGHGYLVSSFGAGSPGKETTYFGALTKQAVIKFQQANKLVVDGIVGKNTRAILNK